MARRLANNCGVFVKIRLGRGGSKCRLTEHEIVFHAKGKGSNFWKLLYEADMNARLRQNVDSSAGLTSQNTVFTFRGA